jgi:small basic protein
LYIPIIGALIGILIGVVFPYDIPINFVKYTAIAILAALDAIFGGIRAQLGQKFVFFKFITSFFTNTAMAALLAYLGDILGIDIYLGAVVVFSLRIFQNLSLIREEVFDRVLWWRTHEQGKDKDKDVQLDK